MQLITVFLNCSHKQLREYPYLDVYVKRVINQLGIRETVNFDHIKRSYYSVKALNPTQIVPLGPDMSAYGL